VHHLHSQGLLEHSDIGLKRSQLSRMPIRVNVRQEGRSRGVETAPLAAARSSRWLGAGASCKGEAGKAPPSQMAESAGQRDAEFPPLCMPCNATNHQAVPLSHLAGGLPGGR
jgi:hypothetical protein